MQIVVWFSWFSAGPICCCECRVDEWSCGDRTQFATQFGQWPVTPYTCTGSSGGGVCQFDYHGKRAEKGSVRGPLRTPLSWLAPNGSRDSTVQSNRRTLGHFRSSGESRGLLVYIDSAMEDVQVRNQGGHWHSMQSIRQDHQPHQNRLRSSTWSSSPHQLSGEVIKIQSFPLFSSAQQVDSDVIVTLYQVASTTIFRNK